MIKCLRCGMVLSFENIIAASLVANHCEHNGQMFEVVIDSEGFLAGIAPLNPIAPGIVVHTLGGTQK